MGAVFRFQGGKNFVVFGLLGIIIFRIRKYFGLILGLLVKSTALFGDAKAMRKFKKYTSLVRSRFRMNFKLICVFEFLPEQLEDFTFSLYLGIVKWCGTSYEQFGNFFSE